MVEYTHHEFELNGKTYELNYPSVLALAILGETKPLIDLVILQDDGKKIEIYLLRKFPIKSKKIKENIVQHVVLNSETQETRILEDDHKSLEELLNSDVIKK